MRDLEQILLEKKLVDPQLLAQAKTIQKHSSRKTGEILVDKGLLDEENLAKCLAELIGWPFCEEGIIDLQRDYFRLEKPEIWQQRAVLPVILDGGDNREAILFADPFNESNSDFVSSKLKLGHIPKLVSTETKILRAIRRFTLPEDWELQQIENIIARFPSQEEVKTYESQGQEISINMGELINNLIKEAVKREASDIHIEPTDLSTDVRLRIDGVIQPLTSMNKVYHHYLANAIYGRTGVDPQSFRKAHDAQFSHYISGQKIDIRLSSIPAQRGADLVLRILNRKKMIIPFSELGYSEEDYHKIKKITSRPKGLFLFTGPVGSGKTTAQAALLSLMKRENRKILTIEDPVEIELPLAQQVSVNPDTGMTFASATRAFLRHDPDVLLIGEIRDEETMKEAFRATLTGCKTFSTLHTSNCYTALSRLRDLGIGLSYLAQGLEGIVSQRLVRKLCSYCKVKKPVPENEEQFLAEGVKEAYFSVGCRRCFRGYSGRTVVAEVLAITPRLRKIMLKDNMPSVEAEINRMEERGEFHTLQQDAIRLVKEGVTSIEEVKKIVGIEEEIIIEKASTSKPEEPLNSSTHSFSEIMSQIAKKRPRNKLGRFIKNAEVSKS